MSNQRNSVGSSAPSTPSAAGMRSYEYGGRQEHKASSDESLSLSLSPSTSIATTAFSAAASSTATPRGAAFVGNGRNPVSTPIVETVTTPSSVRSSIFKPSESYSDIPEEDVQKMAAALAPQLDELENLLGDMHDLNGDRKIPSDDGMRDDDLDEEMDHLLASEMILREQMEFADDFSTSLIASLTRSPGSNLDPEEQITPSKRAAMEPEQHLRDDADMVDETRREAEEPPEQWMSADIGAASLTSSAGAVAEDQTSIAAGTATSSTTASSSPTYGRSKQRHKKKMPLAYTLQDHADHLQLSSEKIGGWYYCDLTKFLDLDPTTMKQGPVTARTNGDSKDDADEDFAYSTELLKEYCLPVPFRKLKRLYTGLLHHDVNVHNTSSLSSKGQAGVSAATPTKAANVAAMRAAVGSPLPHQAQTPSQPSEPELQTIQAKAGKAVVGRLQKTGKKLTPNRGSKNQSEARGELGDNVRPGDPALAPQEEPLPIRTMSLRIRPDVLCGAVMEAVHSGFTAHADGSPSIASHVLKRQGGHFRAALVYPHPDAKSETVTSMSESNKSIIAYVVDVQLCTLKSDELERRLVMRFYHIQDDPEAMQEAGAMLAKYKQDKAQGEPAMPSAHPISFATSLSKANPEANAQVKQACSLIQRLMAAANAKSGKKGKSSRSISSAESAGDEPLWLNGVLANDAQYDRKEDLQGAVATHLETNYRPCPSVREENKKATPPTIRRLTLPALSSKDWSMFDVSWPLVATFWEALETRDCTYNTLMTLPFGQFPSLPTLDVHYCSQLRRLSREAMISQLLKSAKELEDYAKSAEYSCATLLTLLDPMVSHYGAPPLSPPRAKALEEYPLDYAPPQVACPPWGTKVMEALNQVQQMTAVSGPMASVFTGMSGMGIDGSAPAATAADGDQPQQVQAPDAVEMVYNAFVKQDDEEQGARLGRKNAQVMDRLSKMQSHQQAVIRGIRDSHVHSKVALKASDSFVIKAQQANNIGKPGHPTMLLAQVPLLHFRISLGTSTSGTCYITPNQILFSTSFIPLVGSSKVMLFDLALVQFQVVENVTSTLLKPFPNTMNVVVNREVVYSFRPALNPNRLWTFLNVVQTSIGDAGMSEFSQPDQAVVEDEEGVLRLANSVSDDQYSI